MTRTEYMREYVARPGKKERKREIDRVSRAKRKVAKNAWDREYRKRNQEVVNAKARLRRKVDAVKVHARDAVNNAVQSGRLMRRPCERCGVAKAEAHHPDYSKPLEVIWLCDVCHGLEHRI